MWLTLSVFSKDQVSIRRTLLHSDQRSRQIQLGLSGVSGVEMEETREAEIIPLLQTDTGKGHRETRDWSGAYGEWRRQTVGQGLQEEVDRQGQKG